MCLYDYSYLSGRKLKNYDDFFHISVLKAPAAIQWCRQGKQQFIVWEWDIAFCQ